MLENRIYQTVEEERELKKLAKELGVSPNDMAARDEPYPRWGEVNPERIEVRDERKKAARPKGSEDR